MSFFSWGSAFETITSSADSSSIAFDNLKDVYRVAISTRLAEEYTNNVLPGGYDGNPDNIILPLDSTDSRYYQGYGPTSPEVLIPAFLAAYGYKDTETVSLRSVPKEALQRIIRVMPNWKISYDGLGKIEALQEFVNSITLNHAYRSTFSVGSYISNPFFRDTIYMDGKEAVPVEYDLQGNFMVGNNINSISINEQFSPLFNINMDWKNSLTTRFEFKKSRTVGLNMANSQVNEVRSNEIIFGAGYRFNQVPLIINQREITSDMNVRLDFSIRNNQTVIRKLEGVSGSEITAGQQILSIKATADYMLSNKFTIRAFYDQRLTNPYISNSFPNANYNVGFSLTFTL